MADYQLQAQYLKQAIVRDRNLGGLVAWSAYVGSEAIPAEQPEPDWVRLRIVAEQIPAQAAIYVERTIAYFLQDPQTETNIRDYLSQWNDEAEETSLSAQVQAVIDTFMPRFAALDVSDAQVQDWYVRNGFSVPEARSAKHE